MRCNRQVEEFESFEVLQLFSAELLVGGCSGLYLSSTSFCDRVALWIETMSGMPIVTTKFSDNYELKDELGK